MLWDFDMLGLRRSLGLLDIGGVNFKEKRSCSEGGECFNVM